MQTRAKAFWLAGFLGVCLGVGAMRSAVASVGGDVAVPAAGLYVNSSGSPLLPLIDSTRQTLDIEIYTMTSKLVRQSLRTALARGVRIRVIQESSPVSDGCTLFTEAAPALADPGVGGPSGPNGNKGANSPDCRDLRKLVQEVRGANGGQYVPFNKPALCGGAADHCHQHGKMVISDGKTAMLSTGNFDDTNLCDPRGANTRCNRDYSMVLSDAQKVGTLADIFAHDLVGNSYDLQALLSQHGNTSLTVSPLSLQPLLDFIGSARRSIRIENQYLKEKQINVALAAKAREGVHIELTVASPCAFGKPSVVDAKNVTEIYSEFDSAGIVSRMFNASIRIAGKTGYMHAKAIVVDETRAWVGSVNGSDPAVGNNREFGVFFDDPKWVATMNDTMKADITDPNQETWQEGLQCKKDLQLFSEHALSMGLEF